MLEIISYNNQNVVSLDAPISDDSDTTLGSLTAATREAGYDAVESRLAYTKILEQLASLLGDIGLTGDSASG